MTPQTLLSRGTKRFLFICLQLAAITLACWLLWFLGTSIAKTAGWQGLGADQPALILPSLSLLLYFLVERPVKSEQDHSSSHQRAEPPTSHTSTTYISRPGRYRAEGNRIIQN